MNGDTAWEIDAAFQVKVLSKNPNKGLLLFNTSAGKKKGETHELYGVQDENKLQKKRSDEKCHCWFAVYGITGFLEKQSKKHCTRCWRDQDLELKGLSQGGWNPTRWGAEKGLPWLVKAEKQYDSSLLMYQWSKTPWRWAFLLLMDTLGRKMNEPKPATSKFMLEIRRFVTVGEVMFWRSSKESSGGIKPG